MARKELIGIDGEIASLRRECEEGRANNLTIARLKELLMKRKELITQMVGQRQIAFAA